MNQLPPPLPVRDGVAPSYVWLPHGRWPNVLAFLLQRFPAISAESWHTRLEKGEVVDAGGRILHANTPVQRGMCIYYYREIGPEQAVPFAERILYQDRHLLVVDKPHFLPVIPTGRFLNETLLVRLKKATGLHDLSPIHRLDRDTAGVMLFSCERATRGAYQTLFASRSVKKVYQAWAPALAQRQFPLAYRSRLEESPQFFVMHETQGAANSETHIDVLEKTARYWRYQLQPVTGKKHQLRAHLCCLGAPILNDRFYPVAHPPGADDFSLPLQLLAKSIAFTDPIDGSQRQFESSLTLWDAGQIGQIP